MLNDLNRELIAAFRAVRDDAGALIERLGELERAYLDLDGAEREDCYYGLREEYRELVADGGASDIEVASRLIFLNKTCFNGLFYSRLQCCGVECVSYDPARIRLDVLRVWCPGGAGRGFVSAAS